MKKLILVLMVLLASCLGCPPRQSSGPGPETPPEIVVGAPVQIHFYGDTFFSKEQREDIEYAANLWKEQTSGAAEITISWDLSDKTKDGTNIILYIDSEDPNLRLSDCRSSPGCDRVILGFTTSGGVHNPFGEPVFMGLVPERSAARRQFRQVVVHEFGHALGLSHVGENWAIMYPISIVKNADLRLTKIDLDAFCHVSPSACLGRTMHE